MIKIKEAIVVEGAYDKIKLSSVIDTIIITTDGFSIFKNKEKLQFLHTIAQKTGLIVMTDPDRAGFQIRNYVKQGLPQEHIKHAYIPDIMGKERRKTEPSKEGKLGVEGVDAQLIITALKNAGATFIDNQPPPKPHTGMQTQPITKADFYIDGLSGGTKSTQRRHELAAKLGLPARISANMLIDVINVLIDYDEYRRIVDEMQ